MFQYGIKKFLHEFISKYPFDYFPNNQMDENCIRVYSYEDAFNYDNSLKADLYSVGFPSLKSYVWIKNITDVTQAHCVDTFDKVQEKIRQTKSMYPKHSRNEQAVEYMLKGIVRCDTCGSTLTVINVLTGFIILCRWWGSNPHINGYRLVNITFISLV